MPVYKDADDFFRSAEDWLVYFSRVVFSFILKRER